MKQNPSSRIEQRIGFLGVGNMGTAILEGLLKNGIALPSQISIYDIDKEKTARLTKAWKVQTEPTVASVLAATEVILLAVKPQDLPNLGSGLARDPENRRYTVISILAGTPIEALKQFVGKKAGIVRAMPNLCAKVGEAITALTSSDPQALGLAEKIFSGCGKTVVLGEQYFDLVTAVSGSGPAYFFYLMELMTEFGKNQGLEAKDAQCLAIQTALGAARLAESESSSHSLEDLRKRVTSKGGTTEAALKVLQDQKFDQIFLEALTAALKRGRELSQR